MKKRFALILIVMIVMAMTLQAFAITAVEVKGISLAKTQLTLNVGKTYDISVSFSPSNTTQKLLTYATGNKNVATVDKNGRITAVRNGTTAISVISTSNSKVLAKCSVIVVPKIDTGKQVELSMYLVGDAPAGFDTMNAELNKMLMKDINATIKFNFLSWGDYDKKYPLILASGEPFDMIYSANWISYDTQAQKGGFMALDTLLPKYAPQLNDYLPKAAIDQCKVEGKLYMIPSMDVGTIASGFVVRGDLLKKYKIAAPHNMDQLGVYLDAIKKNEPAIVPLNLAGTRAEIAGLTSLIDPKNDLWTGGFGLGLNILGSYKDPSRIFSLYFTPEYAAFIKVMKTWADKGYWSKSMLSNKVASVDAFKNGTSAVYITNVTDANATYLSVVKDHPTWDPQYCEIKPDVATSRDVYKGNGVSLGANAPNPERAMMFLELVNTNEAYHDITYYGIKGVNYTLTTDNKRQAVAGKPMFSGEDTSIWGWSNSKFTKYPVNIMPDYTTIVADEASRAVDSPYATFVFNSDNVKSELAALANVRDQYATPLSAGMVSDVDSSLKTLQDQLKTAGIDKVVAEVAKQVKAYLGK